MTIKKVKLAHMSNDYSAYDAQPEVYPSPLGVQRDLSKFKKMQETEQSKKMASQESFLLQQIAEANEELKKLRKENREKEITLVMFRNLTGEKSVQDLNLQDLNDLECLIGQYLKNISQRMEKMGVNEEQEEEEEDRKPQVMAVVAEATGHAEASKVVLGLDDQPAGSGRIG